MGADAGFLLLTACTVVAMEYKANPISISFLHLAQLTTVWAACFSCAGTSLLLLFALLHGVENRWTELARRWVGFKVVICG